MSHPSKVKGTRWESAVRDWWNGRLLPLLFRPALHGALDKGDLYGLPDWTIQCRDVARLELPKAVDDAEEQARNAGTPFAVAIVKRRRKGVERAFAVMSLEMWADLVTRNALTSRGPRLESSPTQPTI